MNFCLLGLQMLCFLKTAFILVGGIQKLKIYQNYLEPNCLESGV